MARSDSAGVAYPILQFLLIVFAQSDPILHSRAKLTRWDHSMLDPVVHDGETDRKTLRHLLHRQLLRFLEHCRRDLIAPTDPVDNLCGVRLTRGTAMTFSIELRRDLRIA